MFNCQLLPAKTQELFNIIKSFDIRQLSKEVGFIERVRKLCPEALIMALLTLLKLPAKLGKQIGLNTPFVFFKN